MRVLMKPHLSELGNGESGIHSVVRKYFEHLPEFDIELVAPDATSYDLRAAHAGITGPDCEVCHCHGLYFSGDYNAEEWEWRVNARVIEAIRSAREITVPSEWVAETLRRDCRLNPFVIPHGIDWQEWQHNEECMNYVLWNKNRAGADVCDNSILDILIERFPNTRFLSTFITPKLWGIPYSTGLWPKNFKVIETGGRTPHPEMRRFIQRAGVYLSTTKETFGLSVLESLASGTPVLGWDTGGNSFLVQHGVDGYLARPGDVNDLCEGLNYCLKYRDILGANGRELARAWTWQKAGEMVAGVYRLAMEDRPATVSVIIPVYNKPVEQVRRAIASCYTQTLEPKNIIIVNDGSDNFNEIRDWVASYENDMIFCIEQSNQGVATARNNGISHANSKYVCCLDADDWLQPTFLETCVNELEKDSRLGIAYTGLRAHNADGTNSVSPWPNAFDPDKQLTYPKQNQIPTACVFRRDAWEWVGGYKSRYCPYGAGSEDAAFWSAICSIGYGAKLIDKAVEVKKAQFDIIRQYEARGIKDYKPTDSEIKERIAPEIWDDFESCLFNHTGGGTANRFDGTTYPEVDWLSMYPWASDGQHPFASVATPKRLSHPVRQYDDPAISVIIPVGPGHEKEVMNALDSLEMQHFRKWEAVVVDDTNISTSDHDQFYHLATAYSYVRWESTAGGRGAGIARNLGASSARAPLLFFLDADDVLATPDALDRMLAAWNDQEAIIYSDYLGKAVWDYEEAVKEFGSRLLQYNHKSQTAVFSAQSADYSADLAQRQPEFNQTNPRMPYYHWCLVSVLIPKAWHNAIGGFDEAMKTWEDVDYHWRAARAGYCFYRVPEQLVMYAYHKGHRREASQVNDAVSLQKHQEMIQYIKNKPEYQREPEVCNCGKRKTVPAINGGVQADGMNDGDFVMIVFDFPGSATRENYGQPLISPTGQTAGGKRLDYHGYNRKKGDRFLVHVADQRARPDMFKLVPNEVKAPEAPRVELPAPVLIEQDTTLRRRGKRAKVAA